MLTYPSAQRPILYIVNLSCIDKEIAEYPGGWAQLQIDFPPSTDTLTDWAEFMSEEFKSKHGYEPTG